ncbi:MAG: hypothetical protein ABIL39_08585 [candidate division WOR-3 bacterium]
MKFKLTLSTIFLLGTIIILNAQSYPPDGWRVEIDITSRNGDQKSADICAVQNTIHVIYCDNWNDPTRSRFCLYYKKSEDFGFNWTESISLSLPEENVVAEANCNKITALGEEVYVLYTVKDNYGERYFLKFIKSTNGGTSWSELLTIYGASPWRTENDIVVSNDSIRIIFTTGWDVCYGASGLSGTSWCISTIPIQTPNVPFMSPSIALRNNHPRCVFGGGWGPSTLYYAKFDNNQWQVSQIDGDPLSILRACIALEGVTCT